MNVVQTVQAYHDDFLDEMWDALIKIYVGIHSDFHKIKMMKWKQSEFRCYSQVPRLRI